MAKNKCQKLTSELLENLLGGVDTILLDCDGVLYRGNKPIQGAPDAVKKLKSLGKTLYYFTNNASKTRKEYKEKLHNMGYPVTEDHIISSGFVAAFHLSEMKRITGHKLGKIFCLGSGSLIKELEAAGLSVLKNEHSPAGKGEIEMATNYIPDAEVGCVLASLDEELTYFKVAKAIRYLSSPSCLFVATNLDSILPGSNDILLPDCGPLVAMLSNATKREPNHVCGKPNELMFEVAQKKFTINPGRALMIGDRLDTDIDFASTLHLTSILVLTGISTAEDAKKLDNHLQPDFIANSLADFTALLGHI